MLRRSVKRPASPEVSLLHNNFKYESGDITVIMNTITPKEYKRRIQMGQFTNELDLSDEETTKIKTKLITIVQAHPNIYDWEKRGLQKNHNQTNEWISVACRLFEETGYVFNMSILNKWWKYLKEAYRRKLYRLATLEVAKEDELENCNWCHFESMHFVRHTLEKSLDLKRKSLMEKAEKSPPPTRERQNHSPEPDQEPAHGAANYDNNVEAPKSKKAKTALTLDDILQLPPPPQETAQERSLSPETGEKTPEVAPSSSRSISVPSTAPIESWERDVDYIHDEMRRIFETLKEDPKKVTDAKRKLLNCLWELEC